MQICAIICELNPAHNGHKYIFEKAKEITGADNIIAIMSGDYVQRGEPAIMNKSVRTLMALSIGADAVFELPGISATGSAQYFARGAMAIIKALGCDSICFGSESGDIEYINKNETLKSNDILAREYLSAAEYLNYNIVPYPVKRTGSDYNDTDNFSISSDNTAISSASYQRKILFETGEYNNICLPPIISIISKQYFSEHAPLYFDDLSAIILERLITEGNNGFNEYFDIYDNLSDKIIKNTNSFTTPNEFVHLLKSKEIALSHLMRGLLHIVLNYTKEDVNYLIANGYISYIRLLGINKNCGSLLNEIKKRCTLPIISKPADAYKLLGNKEYNLFKKDIAASNLYSYIANQKIGKPHIDNELTRPFITINS